MATGIDELIKGIRGGIYGQNDQWWYGNNTTGLSTPTMKDVGYTPNVAELPSLQMPAAPTAPKITMPAAPGTEGGAALPTIERPEIKAAQFKAPEWSEEAITSLQQKRAAPGVRALKEGLREVSATTSANDPISRHNAREQLGAYSKGLTDVMAGAHSAAIQEYSTKYGYEFQSAAIQFEAEGDALAMEYKGNLAINMAEYEGKLKSVMAEYQTQVAGASMEYQAAFDIMMRQYELESKTSMLKYETEANRQRLQAELEYKAAALDFDAIMQDYMFSRKTGEIGTTSVWGKPGLFSGQLGEYNFQMTQAKNRGGPGQLAMGGAIQAAKEDIAAELRRG